MSQRCTQLNTSLRLFQKVRNIFFLLSNVLISGQTCDSDVFTCTNNNPCDPLCDPDVYNYPGNWENKFIECTETGECYEGTCPSKTHWDQKDQRCEGEDG